MNDPIKKFVRENREAFDHLEPSADVLQRLKAQLKPVPKLKKRRLIGRYFVAASLLIGLALTFTLWDRITNVHRQHNDRIAQQPAAEMAKGKAESKTESVAVDTPKLVEKPSKQEFIVAKAEEMLPIPKNIYTQLMDSSSASNRLTAVLEIERSVDVNKKISAMLFETMNHDSNGNVRIAALELLGKHIDKPMIADMLMQSLEVQDDPFVQLGLIHVLEQVDSNRMEKTLFNLIDDPLTQMAVKDEAYAVLLNRNKL